MFKHKPVLLREVMELLDPEEGQVFVDCTLGSGGHTREILERVGRKGKVIALDIDRENIEVQKKLARKTKKDNLILIQDNFKNLGKVLSDLRVKKVDGILADLGFSSDQLKRIKGLSFQRDEELDMRLDKSRALTAEEIVNGYSKEELVRLLTEYGEERRAGCIAGEIVKRRKKARITRTFQLRDLVRDCYSGCEKVRGIDVATKTFMALRIAVNDELRNLEKFLRSAVECLQEEGKLAVISFHSLEDRRVKKFFQREASGCICGEDQLQCTCNHKPRLKIITKKPVKASKEELKENIRARSAKLRVAQKKEH